jgi:hypothetical protein
MVTGILTHEVENFDSWLAGFSGDSTGRDAAGIRIKGVYRSVDNPSMVTIVSEADTAEHYSRMMSNPQFQETMKNAGVKGRPDLKMTTQVA